MTKALVFIGLLIGLYSCQMSQDNKLSPTTADTSVVKVEKELKGYELGYLQKSHDYYWISGQDTADLYVNVYARQSDSTVGINIGMKKAVLFVSALEQIKQISPLIARDFDLSRLKSLYFETPIYFPDLATELAVDYEKKFGNKEIKYDKLNDFLLNSSLNSKLNNYLISINKKVKRYNIEKFHFIQLDQAFKDYYEHILRDMDWDIYPSFTIHGMGIAVEIEDL